MMYLTIHGHCEEWNDETISGLRDCFAKLAMTVNKSLWRNYP